MPELLILLSLFVVIGAVCGIISTVLLCIMEKRLRKVEKKCGIVPERSADSPEYPIAKPVLRPAETPPSVLYPQPPAPKPILQASSSEAAKHEVKQKEMNQAHDTRDDSLEMLLGMKWLNWIGIVLVVIGVGFFLKYAMDNNWIGPLGRVALGVIAGVISMGLGEWYRRQDYPILFRTLAGGGIAIFYVCTYYSLQVQIIAATPAFMLSILISMLAIVLSVAYDARVLCLIAQIGGFLSPVLFSTGENRPLELFTYILILDLITIGVAFFKQWRDVFTLAFAGTTLIYIGWFGRYYNETQLGIALTFSTLFYLTFLIASQLHPLLHRKAAEKENYYLLTITIIAALINYWVLLYWKHWTALGFVVIGQALTLLLLYFVYNQRCRDDRNTINILLISTLCLITIAIPLHLRLYGIAIAWAVEGIILAYIARNAKSKILPFFSIASLTLAVLVLFNYLPLHHLPFTLFFNRPFVSWAIVIAAGFTVSALLKKVNLPKGYKHYLLYIPAVGSIVLTFMLLHLEVYSYWWVQRDIIGTDIAVLRSNSSTLFLWSMIVLVLVEMVRRLQIDWLAIFAAIAYSIGVFMFFSFIPNPWEAYTLPFFHIHFFVRLIMILTLGYGAYHLARSPLPRIDEELREKSSNAMEITAHIMMFILLAVEIVIWIGALESVSPMHKHGIISAFWSLYSFILICVGLKTDVHIRRILGFLFFGITILKIFLIDTSVVDPAYRILSFIVCGLFLIIAGYVYQRYARLYLQQVHEPAMPEVK